MEEYWRGDFSGNTINDNVEILEAKQVELTNWGKHIVYDETEDVGQKVISVRWV